MNWPFLTRAGGAVAVGVSLWFCAVAMAQPCNPPAVGRFDVPLGEASPSQARVDLDDTVVAIADRSSPGPFGGGSAYVYRRTNTGWSSAHWLRPPGDEGWTGFGNSISVNGDHVLVGGDRGAVAYSWDSTQWVREQIFPTEYAPFPLTSVGEVKLVGDMALIREPLNNGVIPGGGKVHVFRRCHGWLYAQQLSSPGGVISDEFGASLASDGQSVFVGAPLRDSGWNWPVVNGGAVYVFKDNGSAFGPGGELAFLQPTAGAKFGAAMACDGTLLAVGAPGHAVGFTPPIPQAGAVFLYTRWGNDWVPRNTVFEPTPTSGSNFGRLVALDNGWLTVASNAGAYAYHVDDPGNIGTPIDLQAAGDSNPVIGLAAGGFTALVLRADAENAVLYDLLLSTQDCNTNGIPDYAELAAGTAHDCQGNCTLDECEIAFGPSTDCNLNTVPDECEPDCNESGRPDSCDIADGLSPDCDANGIPDECQDDDCDFDGVPDSCLLATGPIADCDADGVLDDCVVTLNEFAPSTEIAERQLHFGAALDTDGERLIVGADPGFDSEATPGAAMVYRRNGAEWMLEAVLDAAALPTGITAHRFGWSVAIDDPVVVVGAERAAAVYRRSGDDWPLEAILLPDHYEGNSEYFGAAVDVEGDLIVVGDASGHPTTAWGGGAVSVFRRTGGVWAPEQVFFGHRPGGYGWKVQLQGERFVTTSYDARFGAFLVVRRGDEWQVEAELPGPDPWPRAWAASLEGDTLAVATNNNDVEALIYRFDGVNWTPAGVVPRPMAYSGYETHFALVAGRALVVAEAYNQTSSFRSTHVFREDNGTWHLARESRAPSAWGSAAFAPSGSIGVYSDLDTNTVTLIDPLSPRCGCPAGVVEFLDPPPGVVDARQAHPDDGSTATYGIDSVLVRAPEGSVECWSLCDTAVSPMDQLRISQIERLGGDQYLIKLARPMTPGMQARITYTDLYDQRATAEFTFRPGDVNADGATTPADVMTLINVLNGQQSAPWGVLSTDIDRSGTTDYADVARLIEIVQQGSQSGPSGTASAHWRGCP